MDWTHLKRAEVAYVGHAELQSMKVKCLSNKTLHSLEKKKTRDGYSAVKRDLSPTSSASPSRKANELVGLQREAPLRSFLDALKDPLHHFITAVPFRLKKLRCAWNELLRVFLCPL